MGYCSSCSLVSLSRPSCRINEWLSQLEHQMQVSLATAVARDVEAGRQMAESGEVKTYSMIYWLDGFPTQISVLSTQVPPCSSFLSPCSLLLAICSLLFAPRFLLLAFSPCSPRSPLLLTTSSQVLWSEQVVEVLVRGSRAEAGMVGLLAGVDRMLGLLENCVLQEQPPLRRKKIEHLIGEYVLRLLINNKVVSNKDCECLWQIHFYYNPKQTDDYLTKQQKLVHTLMTERCYLTMTQALEVMLGGSTFGSAGTGKSDTAEDTKISLTVELVGKRVMVMPDRAIFITMNPTYAGRSNLLNNPKKLFRSLAMTAPDSTMIAEVTFFSQGFRTAEKPALKIVPFFRLCDDQQSQQLHYDLTLKALKSVLASDGNIKTDPRLFSVCQVLLLRSGIESNPGPPSLPQGWERVEENGKVF